MFRLFAVIIRTSRRSCGFVYRWIGQPSRIRIGAGRRVLQQRLCRPASSKSRKKVNVLEFHRNHPVTSSSTPHYGRRDERRRRRRRQVSLSLAEAYNSFQNQIPSQQVLLQPWTFSQESRETLESLVRNDRNAEPRTLKRETRRRDRITLIRAVYFGKLI